MDRLIVYVDGFNLYHGLHEAAQCRWLWLDLVALAEKLRPRSQLVAVRYFTAPVCGQQDALARQQTYHQALEVKYPGQVQIIEGRYQRNLVDAGPAGRDGRTTRKKKPTSTSRCTWSGTSHPVPWILPSS